MQRESKCCGSLKTEFYSLAATLPPDVLQHYRSRCVTLQCNRLCVRVDRDFGVDRRLALSRSFGVEPQFDNREVVIGCSCGCDRLPGRAGIAKTAIAGEEDTFASIGHRSAICVTDRVSNVAVVEPKIADGRSSFECRDDGGHWLWPSSRSISPATPACPDCAAACAPATAFAGWLCIACLGWRGPPGG